MRKKYDQFVKRVYGIDWRSMPENEVDGAFGVAICRAIMDGVNIDLKVIASHIDVDASLLYAPYDRLSKNGFMKSNKLASDKNLVNNDMNAWCYMAGYASGHIGLGS